MVLPDFWYYMEVADLSYLTVQCNGDMSRQARRDMRMTSPGVTFSLESLDDGAPRLLVLHGGGRSFIPYRAVQW
ncbi:hypothetical protein L6452_17957 [Arctium lappa]|uniref:Uncharacterized protein n=1 Tax=Arctium lappa TaxID=4217 RepID=A0ACB9C557_ARCLA|nr:hypothetical protein L6452_17957 [Arctium lappa]